MPTRWCRGRRPRPWSRPRSRRSARAPRRARCASPISAPARARCCSRCSRELPAAHGVGTDISAAALACARDNAAALGLAAARAFVACDYGAALARRRSISSSPIRPMSRRGDIAALAAGGARLRSARARSTAARTGSTAYRAIAADARRLLAPRRPAGGRARRRPARRGAASLTAAAGLAPRRRRDTIWPASPRALGHGSHSRWPSESACLHNSATQKSTWIVGQERLGFAQESTRDARADKSPQRRFGEPQARRRETREAG